MLATAFLASRWCTSNGPTVVQPYHTKGSRLYFHPWTKRQTYSGSLSPVAAIQNQQVQCNMMLHHQYLEGSTTSKPHSGPDNFDHRRVGHIARKLSSELILHRSSSRRVDAAKLQPVGT